MAVFLAVLFLHQAENFPRRYVLERKGVRLLHVMWLVLNFFLLMMAGMLATGPRGVLILAVACGLYWCKPTPITKLWN
jgi:hypothetical protein